MRGGCCAHKHTRRQKQHRWAMLLFLPNPMKPIRSALISEKTHSSESSYTTKVNDMQLWEIKPCEEVQLAISVGQMPPLCCPWTCSSFIVLGFSLAFNFIHDYESPFVLGKTCLGWRSRFLCMGPVLCSKTVGDCSIWNLPFFFPFLESWELAPDFMTQVLFLADYTWLWTVATMCAGKGWGWRRKPDPDSFPERRKSFERS